MKGLHSGHGLLFQVRHGGDKSPCILFGDIGKIFFKLKLCIIPGNILRSFVEKVGKIIRIGTDIGAVFFKGMVSKTAEGDHLSESDQIIVHNGTALVIKRL